MRRGWFATPAIGSLLIVGLVMFCDGFWWFGHLLFFSQGSVMFITINVVQNINVSASHESGTWKVRTKEPGDSGQSFGRATGSWVRGDRNTVVRISSNSTRMDEVELCSLLCQVDFCESGLALAEWRDHELVMQHELMEV